MEEEEEEKVVTYSELIKYNEQKIPRKISFFAADS